jgi:hypothetical protein
LLSASDQNDSVSVSLGMDNVDTDAPFLNDGRGGGRGMAMRNPTWILSFSCIDGVGGGGGLNARRENFSSTYEHEDVDGAGGTERRCCSLL